MPEPAWMRFRLHKTPHFVELRAEPTTHLQLIRAPDFYLNLLGMHGRQHAMIHRLQLRLFFFQFFNDGGGTDMQHTSGIPNATGVHRHVDNLLLNLGGVTGVAVLQEESAPVAYRLLATIALLALAGLPMSDDIGPLAVRAMQDLHNHAITRVAWGVALRLIHPERITDQHLCNILLSQKGVLLLHERFCVAA